MGREIRMVPPNWDHPKKNVIRFVPRMGLQYVEEFQPMHDEQYEKAASNWESEYSAWMRGERPSYWTKREDPEYFWDWHGMPPDKEYYRPWNDEEATWFQLWETVSEGTPVSPPFSSKEELAEYLAEHGDYWDQKRGDGGWGIERASAFVHSGWAPSFMVVHTSDTTTLFQSKDIPLGIQTGPAE